MSTVGSGNTGLPNCKYNIAQANRADIGAANITIASISDIVNVNTIDGIPFPPPGTAGPYAANNIITATGNALPNPPIQASGVSIYSHIPAFGTTPAQDGKFIECGPVLGTSTFGYDSTNTASIYTTGGGPSGIPNTQLVFQQSNIPKDQYIWNSSGGNSVFAKVDNSGVRSGLLLNSDFSVVLQSSQTSDVTVNGANAVNINCNYLRVNAGGSGTAGQVLTAAGDSTCSWQNAGGASPYVPINQYSIVGDTTLSSANAVSPNNVITFNNPVATPQAITWPANSDFVANQGSCPVSSGFKVTCSNPNGNTLTFTAGVGTTVYGNTTTNSSNFTVTILHSGPGFWGIYI